MGVTSRAFELTLSAKNLASKTIKNVVSELKRSGEHAESINNKFNALFGLAIVQQVKGFIQATIDANDALNDMADRTGLSVENLSKLSEVAQAGDTSVETLTKALNKLNVEAVKSPESFEALGINVTDASGKMKDSQALFNEVADKIASVENPARRAAIATQVFGKAGLELMPILKSGSDGIKGWTDDAERLGAVTSTDLAQASGEFNDNIQRITMSAKGMSNAVSTAMLPSINLVLAAFVKYRAEAAEMEKSNATTAGSLEELAASEGFQKLTSAVGFIGDAIQGFANVAEISLHQVDLYIKHTVNAFVALAQMSSSLIEGNYKGVAAAYRQSVKQANEINEEFSKAGEKALLSERFSDKLARGLETAMKKSKDAAVEAKKAADDAAAGIGKAGSIALSTATRITNGAGEQIKAITKLSDEATAKSKKAIDEQKKVADDFEKIAKQLAKKTPLNGTLDQQLKRASKDEELRGKYAAVDEKVQAKARDKASAERLDKLQKEADATKAKYETEKDMFNKSKMEKAAADLKREKDAQEQAEEQQVYLDLQKDIAKEDISAAKRMDERLAAMLDLNDAYAQVKENAKTGASNEDQLEQLRELSKYLQKNKDEDTGIFSTLELENYAREIKELANTAASADASVAKKAEELALADAKKRLEELQQQLLSVKFGVDEESVISEADKILEAIQSKLKGITVPVSLKMPEGVNGSLQLEAEPIKRARGGAVYGAGTATSDSIPALLSDGEHIVNTRAAERPGVRAFLDYLNAGGDLRGLIETRRAQGGSVGTIGSTAIQNTNLSIDLRTNNGTFKVSGDTKQEQLDAALRKKNLRRS